VSTPTLDDVQAARELLRGITDVTPLEQSRALGDLVGGPVFFKCENLQRTGSFKLRGAYVRIARLTPAERERGVVAASAGNHAQGVALAARLLDIRSTVFMPEGAPLPKVSATKAYGATVRHAGHTVDDALVAAHEFAAETGAVLIHPFDHPDIVAGQGTCGLELLEQCPDVQTVLVSTGGGGVVGGIALAVKTLRPDVDVIAVQAAGAAAYPGSLAAGHPVKLEQMSTMADGIAVGCPGDVPFALIRDLVDRVEVVDEEELSRGLLLCLERSKLVVEPAGAAAAAAVLARPTTYRPPVVAVLTGGNIDPLLLSKVVRHGLVAAGRYLALRVHVPDRPGELARLLGVLALTRANVLDVEHYRSLSDLHVDEAEVAVQLETRGREDSEAVVGALTAAGYVVRTA
jgi:threonine dehydratase